MPRNELPIPPHFDPEKVGSVWRVPYQERAADAVKWARDNNIKAAFKDRFKICLLLVDVQNTFCIPDFELYVGGRSGTAAIDDNRRLCEFIYRNLDTITEICPTMDSHQALQIFHGRFLVNAKGDHPAPFTIISAEDVENGVWQIDPEIVDTLNMNKTDGRNFLRHYTRELKSGGKYDLTIWPYHAMLGGIGHALVSAVEEAVFFQSIARCSMPDFQLKGENPFTENYSVLSPEVLDDAGGNPIAEKNAGFIGKLLAFDALIMAGQAKSHCVAWTIDDLLNEMEAWDKKLVEKVYLLEDCTSPVVIPGVVDYTDQADAAFKRFLDAGMHGVRSTDPMKNWPGLDR